MKRRTLLKGTGAVTVLVAAGGVWRAYDQGIFDDAQGPAFEPWQAWQGDDTQGPLALVQSAVLAASPHNTQPWLFRVHDDQIEIFAALGRNLGSFDPFFRELHLGVGCALENLVLAAPADGLNAVLHLTGGGLNPPPADQEPRLVARVFLGDGDADPSPLFAAIPRRHTNRGQYLRERALPAAFLEDLATLADDDLTIRVLLLDQEQQHDRMGQLIVAATEAIIADGEMIRDSEHWFRHSAKAIQEHRDGLTLDGLNLTPWLTAVAKLLPPPSPSRSSEFWLEATREVHVPSARAFGLIAVRDLYDRAQTLRAGRLWQRIHLLATSHGVAMQPLNQPLEMVDRQLILGTEATFAEELAALTGDPAWRPTLAFRMGYAEADAAPSPRRGAGSVLV